MQTYRAMRAWMWGLIVVTVAVGAGCGGGSRLISPDGGSGSGGSDAGGGSGGSDGGGRQSFYVQDPPNRDLDVLFMVDNSQSMAPLVNKLQRNFPAFTDFLKTLPGGLPNIHVAVVSSDLGAGLETRIQGCAPGGQAGEFHDSPTAGCPAAATGFTIPTGDHFISVINGQPNYAPSTLDISDVFSCIANLGDTGCGFEHQLQSVVRALGADPNFPLPDKNGGFLRPNAALAIILLTNEDDCSAPPDTDLFTANQQHVTDPLGQLSSYRCNEFGHLCGSPPMAPPHDTATGDLTPCHSAEDGRLIKVSDMIANIKSLKADPSKIAVAVIGAPPTPYMVNLVTPQVAGDPMAPQIAHSCTTPGTNPPEFGDPGVRLTDFVSSFGAKGLYEEVCAASYVPALQQISQLVTTVVGPTCITGNTSNCTVTFETFDVSGNQVSTPLPKYDPANGNQCQPGSQPEPANCQPSWQLVIDQICPGAFLQVGWPSGAPPVNGYEVVSCAP
jgi:hypothetical protein